TANIGNAAGTRYGYLNLTGAQTLDGTGNIVFGATTNNGLYNTSTGAAGDTGTLTIDTGLTVRGHSRYIGNGGGPVTSKGTVGAAPFNAGTVAATVDRAPRAASYLAAAGGLTVNGTANRGKTGGSTYGYINFSGTQTVGTTSGGTATPTFGASNNNSLNSSTS